MSEWKLPAGLKRVALPPEAILGRQKPRGTKRSKGLTAGQLKWREQKAKSDAQAADFKIRCVAAGMPLPVREYEFAREAMGREWKADFAWPDEKVILEVEGAVYQGGRHTRGSGFVLDLVKYNAMSSLGWRLFRCTPETLCTDATVQMIRLALGIA